MVSTFLCQQSTQHFSKDDPAPRLSQTGKWPRHAILYGAGVRAACHVHHRDQQRSTGVSALAKGWEAMPPEGANPSRAAAALQSSPSEGSSSGSAPRRHAREAPSASSSPNFPSASLLLQCALDRRLPHVALLFVGTGSEGHEEALHRRRDAVHLSAPKPRFEAVQRLGEPRLASGCRLRGASGARTAASGSSATCTGRGCRAGPRVPHPVAQAQAPWRPA